MMRVIIHTLQTTNTYLSIMKEFDGLEGKNYDNVKLLSNNFTKGY